MNVEEPVAVLPGSVPIQLWRTRIEPAAVVLRCGKGQRRCRRPLVEVFETSDFAVVVFYQHTPDQPTRLPTELAEEFVEQRRRIGGELKWDGQSDRALSIGRTDRGTVLCLERDDYWSSIVEVRCSRHMALTSID